MACSRSLSHSLSGPARLSRCQSHCSSSQPRKLESRRCQGLIAGTDGWITVTYRSSSNKSVCACVRACGCARGIFRSSPTLFPRERKPRPYELTTPSFTINTERGQVRNSGSLTPVQSARGWQKSFIPEFPCQLNLFI